MKFRLEVLVDASPETIWKLMDKKDGPGIPIIDDVSERREPHFLAGSYESRSGSAIVVNHFEAIGEGLVFLNRDALPVHHPLVSAKLGI